MQIEDTNNPTNEVLQDQDNPIEIPEGLTLEAVQSKAIKWNQSFKNQSTELQSRWKDNLNLYRAFRHGLVDNIAPQVHEVWANIQSEKPYLVNSIFTKSEVVRAVPKFDDVEDKALKINLFENKMLLSSNPGRRIASEALDDFLTLGTVIYKVFWDNEEILKFDNRDVVKDEIGNPIPNPTAQTWVSEYRGKPTWKNIDNFNFAVDPDFNGSDLNNASWVRERIYFKKDDLLDLSDAGEVVPLTEQDVSGDNKPSDEQEGAVIRSQIGGGSTQSQKTDKVYVDEFWATLHWKENGKRMKGKFYFWLLGDKKIIKFKRNIFARIPYGAARCYPISHQFWGLGDVDVMNSIAKHIDVTHSQQSLLAKATGQKLTFIEKGSGIDPQQLKQQTNGILVVADINKVHTEDTTSGKDLQSMVAYEGVLKGNLSNVVGINEMMRGEAPGDMTATEASILNSNASARLSLKLANFQDEYIAPLARMIYEFSQQFSGEFSFYVDNQVTVLSQSDFDGEYDFIPQGSTALANRQLRIKTAMEFGQMQAQAAMQAAQSNGAVIFPAFNQGKWNQNEVMSLMEVQNPEQYFEAPAMPNAAPMLDPGVDGLVPPQVGEVPMQVENIDAQLGNLEGQANSVTS